MLDFSRQYSSIREEVLTAIETVCLSQKFILGPAVTSFETATARFFTTPSNSIQAIGCASGTDALWLALAAAGIGSLDPSSSTSRLVEPDAVITSPFSFFASVSAILRAGARPILADIDPLTYNLSPASVEAILNSPAGKNVKAILPIHLYGQCADMDALTTIARRHNLLVIEDAAQAFGATWNLTPNGTAGEPSPSSQTLPAGALGDAAAFSFYPTKNLSAYGDAGLLTTRSPEIAAHAISLRAHGMTRRYYHDEIGWNSRLDSIQAAVLEVKLRHLPRWNGQRREIASRYDQLFTAADLALNLGRPSFPASTSLGGPSFPADRNLGGPSFPASSERVGCLPVSVTDFSASDKVILPYTAPRAHHIFHQYVIRAPRRDALRQYLTDRQIGSEIYYPLPLHLQTSLAHLGYKAGDFPESERAAEEVLALPIYPELREDEQQTIVEAIRTFYA